MYSKNSSTDMSPNLNTDNGDKCYIESLRADIINALPDFDSDKYNYDWLLLGTSGCHLCDQAEEILRNLQAVYPISYQLVDIAEFDESLMMTFATTIPVLITQNRRLNYPFSVMDLQQLI